MKKVFAIFLIAHGAIELLAAAALITGPAGIFAAGMGEQWSMHYGFAALTIASVSLWLWPYRSEIRVVTPLLGLLLTFHVSIFVSLTLAGDQAAGMGMHAVLAVMAAILFVTRARWCAPQGTNG
ncbi:MAG: hypothetical protein V2I41_06035 [Pseudomonadales bacterium]|jgi:hypothetical protein|nr:hypothetical protein [Pseudomonadales bacterium]